MVSRQKLRAPVDAGTVTVMMPVVTFSALVTPGARVIWLAGRSFW